MLDGLRNAARKVGDDRALRSLMTDCRRLLSERGEANSVAIARDLVSRFTALRVDAEGETDGLDLALHDERGYTL